MLGPEKCLDSNSLPNMCCAYLFGEKNASFAIGTLLRKPPARTAPMDRLLISRAFLHTLASCHFDRDLNSAHVYENASETQIDTTMTFTVLIVSIEQNEEFQESRVH